MALNQLINSQGRNIGNLNPDPNGPLRLMPYSQYKAQGGYIPGDTNNVVQQGGPWSGNTPIQNPLITMLTPVPVPMYQQPQPQPTYVPYTPDPISSGINTMANLGGLIGNAFGDVNQSNQLAQAGARANQTQQYSSELAANQAIQAARLAAEAQNYGNQLGLVGQLSKQQFLSNMLTPLLGAMFGQSQSRLPTGFTTNYGASMSLPGYASGGGPAGSTSAGVNSSPQQVTNLANTQRVATELPAMNPSLTPAQMQAQALAMRAHQMGTALQPGQQQALAQYLNNTLPANQTQNLLSLLQQNAGMTSTGKGLW